VRCRGSDCSAFPGFRDPVLCLALIGIEQHPSIGRAEFLPVGLEPQPLLVILWLALNERVGGHAEGAGDAADLDCGDSSAAAFDVGDPAGREGEFLGKFDLREVARVPRIGDAPPDRWVPGAVVCHDLSNLSLLADVGLTAR
jgi:hypothetical protein